MQTRLRKTRSSSGHEKSGKEKTSRYQFQKITFLALVFLFSCATHKTKNTVKNEFEKLCFSGEGHGRITFLNSRHLFDYESMEYPKKKRFAFGFHYPALGERRIDLDYGKKVKVGGNFLDELIQETKSDEQGRFYRRILQEFLEKFALVIEARQDPERSLSCTKRYCTLKNGERFFWEMSGNRFSLKFNLQDNYQFFLEGISGDRYFSRMKLYVQNEKDLGLKPNPLEIKLFLDQCYKK